MAIFEHPDTHFLRDTHLSDQDKWVVFKVHNESANKASQYDKKHSKPSAVN